MKDILDTLTQWAGSEEPFAIARVIQTWGSSPRPVGSALLATAEGKMAGSVSGGCVEGAVLREATGLGADVIRSLSYGVSDDEAWTVGLTCGGKIRLLLQTFPSKGSSRRLAWDAMLSAIRKDGSGVMVTDVSEGKDIYMASTGESTGGDFSPEVLSAANGALAHRTSELTEVGGKEYFLHVFPPRKRMLIIGAAHITSDLVQLAHWHDFETIVIDPRNAFAAGTAFQVKPDQLFTKYPSEVLEKMNLDSNVYAVILSHDPKIDDNALGVLLRSPVAYIGALGSRKTHEKRVGRLQAAGFNAEEISRIESPIGLDIGAVGTKEIALSIMASVISRH